jgi:hypothetical protein
MIRHLLISTKWAQPHRDASNNTEEIYVWLSKEIIHVAKTW